MRFAVFVIVLCVAVGASFLLAGHSATAQGGGMASEKPADLPKATLAGGCFWCLDVSRTTCRTAHELREGNLVATASECHTDISFEEEI